MSVEFISILTARAPFQGRPLALSALLFAALLLLLSGDSALAQTRNDFVYWDANGNGDLTCTEARGKDEGLKLPAYADNRNGTRVIYEWLERRTSSDTDNDGIACESTSNPNGYVPGSITPPPPPPTTNARECPAGSATWMGLPVCEEGARLGYDRNAFGSAYSSLEDEIIDGLPKSSGQVYTPYICKLFDIRADGTAATDIEHIVALAEAYDSGLAESQFRTFAGDLANLTLADPAVNRTQKSDRDAGEWGPPQNSGWFAARVVAVKQKYGLSVNPAERDALQAMLNSDPSRTVTCGGGGGGPTTSAPRTVLLAHFANGNNTVFNSRVYLFNPSVKTGRVTVRVFTLPLMGGLAQELTTTPLELGSLGPKSGLNIKLVEDILTPLGITTPYTIDGGNLTLELTILATAVRGTAQVFSSGFGFGTYPLQEIPITSGASPTVLVANFMNGNNAAFNSRVYLWNPSTSAGEVTVRVFTLPLGGGLAQELTLAPLALGTLGARSALNVKLAENILNPLGVSLPYTIDGGNLTLEFTIQVADVKGAAQVFSSDFAFGTQPLQEIPPVSGASPTVLVANFMNGNNAAFNSRVYLFNPSTSAGEVTVRVFTLPLADGAVQELTAEPLALDTLGSRSALNIKLAEDILTPLGIATPYTTDDGNLTLEFTIQAADVKGTAQVFSSDFASGTYTLQAVPSVPIPGPTRLVASFTNGNDTVFNSRISLFNPSPSAGGITVRVFTLPLGRGTAQELTTTPLELGTLEARSALDIRLAEDILVPLQITTPYTTDGGNLVLELTIQAADVRGTAQVFSSRLSLGTYPLDLSGVVLAPTDEAAFNALFVGKRAATNDPTVYVDFVSPGRFRETKGSDIWTGSYTYRNTGPNTVTVTFNYDDGDRCTASLTFTSATTGTTTSTCDDGSIVEYNWRLVEIPSDGEQASSLDHNVILRVVRVTPDWHAYDISGGGWPAAVPDKESESLKYFEVAIWEETEAIHLYEFDNEFDSRLGMREGGTPQQMTAHRESYRIMQVTGLPETWTERSRRIRLAFADFASYLVSRYPDSDHHLMYSGHGGPGGQLFAGQLSYQDANDMLSHWTRSLGRPMGVVDMGGPCAKGSFSDLENFCQYARYYIASDLNNGGYTFDDWTYEKYAETQPELQYHRLFAETSNLRDALVGRINLKRKAYEYSRANMTESRTEQANYLYSCKEFANNFSRNFRAFLHETSAEYSILTDLYDYMVCNQASDELIESFDDVIVHRADNKDFYQWEESRNGMMMLPPY